jgi:hypothetical protein
MAKIDELLQQERDAVSERQRVENDRETQMETQDEPKTDSSEIN